jgi:hypothetical protein
VVSVAVVPPRPRPQPQSVHRNHDRNKPPREQYNKKEVAVAVAIWHDRGHVRATASLGRARRAQSSELREVRRPEETLNLNPGCWLLADTPS